MGKQLQFYMTAADEEQFVSSMRTIGNVLIVLNYFQTPELVELNDSILRKTMNLDGFGSLSLINKDIEPQVIVKPAGLGWYFIEQSESEVIEFSRWSIIRNDGKKEPGRLWYDHEDMNCKPKRKPFLAWAQSVFRHIKKNYHYSKEIHGRYFGPDAWEKFQSGEMLPAPY